MSRQSEKYQKTQEYINNKKHLQMLDEEDVNNNDVWNPEYKQRVDIVLVVPNQESVGRSEFVRESRDLVSKLKEQYDDIIMKVIDEDLPSVEYNIIVEIQFV